MLGHTLYRTLSRTHSDVWAITRKPFSHYARYDLFDEARFVSGFEARSVESVTDTLDQVAPDVVLNCIGMTTRKIGGVQASDVILINSAFPHWLAEWCQKQERSMIHFSTDCVFSGKNGPYAPSAARNAQDLYGLSKALGEVEGEGVLTIRSSIIGLELEGHTELLEWVRSQKNQRVNGFSNVMYSGVTTVTMANVVEQLIGMNDRPSGIQQLASDPISKADLVELASDVLDLGIEVERVSEPVSNKVLIASPSFEKAGIQVPSWRRQLEEVSHDVSQHDSWKAA